MGEGGLEEHLNKISEATLAEEAITEVLQTLWSTRKTGLSPQQRASVKSLLKLPSPNDLSLVLACLRSIVRRITKNDQNNNDIQKLLPPDISIELRRNLALILQKYQNQWKEEAVRDTTSQQHNLSRQIKIFTPPAATFHSFSEPPSVMRSRVDTSISYNNCNNLSGSARDADNSNLPCDNISFDNLEALPQLKSMTWTLESKHSAPANRVAIITLKLCDCTKSSYGEVEVKFQVSKDTLDAMLRSMAYTSEQFSNSEALPQLKSMTWTLESKHSAPANRVAIITLKVVG